MIREWMFKTGLQMWRMGRAMGNEEMRREGIARAHGALYGDPSDKDMDEFITYFESDAFHA